MGNVVLKDYTVSEQAHCSGGLALGWHIYAATKNDVSTNDDHPLSNQRDASVFVCEKKLSTQNIESSLAPKFLTLMRQDASMLSRLRHPSLLRVVQPLTETRNAIVFVTEPVVCSLANLLGNFGNLHHQTDLSEKIPSCIELKKGLRQLGEGLLFLQRDANIYHLSIEPRNVFITPSGEWKLAGLTFALQMKNRCQAIESSLNDWHRSDFLPLLPSLEYASPELVEGERVDHRADSFSLAKLARNMYRLVNQTVRFSAEDQITCISEYRSHLAAPMTPNDMKCLPASLSTSLRQMMEPDTKHRSDISSFLCSEFFNDIQSRTIRYLDKLFEKKVEARIQFLKRLPQVLSSFDNQSLLRHVLPPLTMQLKNAEIAAAALPAFLDVAERIDDASVFTATIFPALEPLIARRDSPQIPFVLIKHMQFLLARCSTNEKRDQIIPLVMHALASCHVKLKLRTLQELPGIINANGFQYRELRSKILPRINEMCVENAPLSVRVAALTCIGATLERFDTDTIGTSIVNAVSEAVREDETPQLLMAAFSVFEQVAINTPLAVSMGIILPSLIRMALSNRLGLVEFGKVSGVIRSLITKMCETREKQIRERSFDHQPKTPAMHAPRSSIDFLLAQDDNDNTTSSTWSASTTPSQCSTSAQQNDVNVWRRNTPQTTSTTSSCASLRIASAAANETMWSGKPIIKPTKADPFSSISVQSPLPTNTIIPPGQEFDVFSTSMTSSDNDCLFPIPSNASVGINVSPHPGQGSSPAELPLAWGFDDDRTQVSASTIRKSHHQSSSIGSDPFATLLQR